VKPVDLQHGPRADAFAFYKAAKQPRWSLTTRVDVAPLLAAAKGWGCSAFVAYHHAILRAANAVPQLRQRLTETGGAVEWAQVDATPTVLRPDDSFAVARLVYAERLRDFAAPAQAAIAAAQQPGAPWGIRPEQSGELHMTTLPLVAFTHFSHARSGRWDDGTPALACGRFTRDGAVVGMPLNIEVHHALVDGLHVGRFVQALEALLQAPDALY
jgi:chloramphenicol O-acetyltransferase type A